MRKKLHTLKRPAFRQSWNKYNLYNLTRLQRQNTRQPNFYQQKFTAKQETRRYHGEHLTKRAWQSIFKSTLRSVVPLNSRDLALYDGSDMAAGRGAGLAEFGKRQGRIQGVPFMSMMFAPMERRLDVAVFRAMFASSVRQGRQFVVHGFVKVNGKKMQYPAYMLNPGDMFSVDPERVLFATGAPKETAGKAKLKKIKAEEEEEASSSEEASPEESPSEETTEKSAAGTTPEETTSTNSDGEATEGEEGEKSTTPQTPREDPNNPLDATKPYATPWRPRDYLSPFAFIPRYLEVNFNICHAVYLRHPVAKPGLAEVPTPFHQDTMQLAFNWFLRRR